MRNAMDLHTKTADGMLSAVALNPQREVVAAFPDAVVKFDHATLTDVRGSLRVTARWVVDYGSDRHAVVNYAHDGWTYVEYQSGRMVRECCPEQIAHAAADLGSMGPAQAASERRWLEACSDLQAAFNAADAVRA